MLLHFPLKVVGYVVHHLSKLSPRQANKWCLGCETGFDGNAKYLFFDLVYNHPEVKVVWITHRKAEAKALRNKGFKAFHWLHPIGVWHCFTAKVYIVTHQISDINAYTSGGAYFVNVCHGVGVKCTRFADPKRLLNIYGYPSIERMRRSFVFRINTFWLYGRKPDMVLVPSYAQARDIFVPMLDIPLSKCFFSNYPRNSILLSDKLQIIDFIRRHESAETLSLVRELSRYKRVYIYMPTFRNDGRDFISNAGFLWLELDAVLKESHSVLLLKLHPRTMFEEERIREYRNIKYLSPKNDAYPILPFTDCLITDYSSVYADYCLMKKEVILYPFDHEEYITRSHKILNYDNYPGRRVYSFRELLDLIKNHTDCHLTEEEHALVMDTYWDSAFNGADIVSEIKRRIGMQIY